MPTHFDSEDEEDFCWDDYLKKTNSEAAPVTCFCQHEVPPSNDFEIGQKIETVDPRNTSSTCIGTIIEKNGPRLRLRLDGTDDRNDFWLPVDSDLIHPFEYSTKLGRSIQPPLGFGFELSRWPKFLEKIISNANDNQFAHESSFKKSPRRPLKNEFKIGHKLEAVDPKNPHLVCPATIVDVKRDTILISFDGWQKSSQFWCSYSSRDIFPVGWCKLASHTLQHPGYLEEKQTNNNNLKRTNSALLNKRKNSTEPSTIKRSSTKKKETTKAKRRTSSVNKRNIKVKREDFYDYDDDDDDDLDSDDQISAADSSITSNLDITVPDDTTTTHTSSPLVTTATSTTNKKNNQTKEQKLSNKIKKAKTTTTTDPASILDLSIVKTEKFDYENEIFDNNNNNQSIEATDENKRMMNSNKNTFTIYINPNADCGPLIKTSKFHLSHKNFGPGLPANLYKSIIQSFIDCANMRLDVFNIIPAVDDDTNDCFIRLKTPTHNQKKSIQKIVSIDDFWLKLKKICQLLSIDDEKLFSQTKTLTKENTKDKVLTTMNYNVLTPQPSSSYSSSSSSSSSSSTCSSSSSSLLNKNKITTSGGKKRSKNDSSLNNINEKEMEMNEPKLMRFTTTTTTNDHIPPITADNSTLSTTEWTIDQVISYINQLGDNYFSLHIDKFRVQEIDGNALLLLTTDILMKYMGFKLGPALKLNNYITKLREACIQRFQSHINQQHRQMIPKSECTNNNNNMIAH